MTFYGKAVETDVTNSPYTDKSKIQRNDGSITTSTAGEKLYAVESIMNDHMGINYRTIYNGYAMPASEGDKDNFTLESDYRRCMEMDAKYQKYIEDKRNPTYANILKWYNDDGSIVEGQNLARYRMQDFLYMKYYNQIPNNYMLTLRRYSTPCVDHMFSLDSSTAFIQEMGNRPDGDLLCTAVTYLGEKPGNKLSEILKFTYGMNYEDKEAEVESLKSPENGLIDQVGSWKTGMFNKDLVGMDMGGTNRTGSIISSGQLGFFAGFLGGDGGKYVKDAYRSKLMPDEQDYLLNKFGSELYGDLNVIDRLKIRSRGITFSNNFSLNFEYSLKSLKCVNPRVAMMDVIANFLVLTGNEASFWGGETRYYGNLSGTPQFGDPDKLRNGDFSGYFKGLVTQFFTGEKGMGGSDVGDDGGNRGVMNFLSKTWANRGAIWEGIKGGFSGAIQGFLGNFLGGKMGVPGQANFPKAILAGNPTGFWHLTVGNPLDPIAMMGNLAVTDTSFQTNDTLGYDDFPTEIKFTVNLEHCMPRGNGDIEDMFNAGKGRFYTFADPEYMGAFMSAADNAKLAWCDMEKTAYYQQNQQSTTGNNVNNYEAISSADPKVIQSRMVTVTKGTLDK